MDVNCVFPNRQCFKCEVMRFGRILCPLGCSAWPECVRKLGDGENAFAVVSLALLLRHAGEQAEVVFFNRLLTASGLKLALGTVPIQDEIGRRLAR